MSRNTKIILGILLYPLYGGWIVYLVGYTLSPFADKDTGMVGLFYAPLMWAITILVTIFVLMRYIKKKRINSLG